MLKNFKTFRDKCENTLKKLHYHMNEKKADGNKIAYFSTYHVTVTLLGQPVLYSHVNVLYSHKETVCTVENITV